MQTSSKGDLSIAKNGNAVSRVHARVCKYSPLLPGPLSHFSLFLSLLRSLPPVLSLAHTGLVADRSGVSELLNTAFAVHEFCDVGLDRVGYIIIGKR